MKLIDAKQHTSILYQKPKNLQISFPHYVIANKATKGNHVYSQSWIYQMSQNHLRLWHINDIQCAEIMFQKLFLFLFLIYICSVGLFACSREYTRTHTHIILISVSVSWITFLCGSNQMPTFVFLFFFFLRILLYYTFEVLS